MQEELLAIWERTRKTIVYVTQVKVELPRPRAEAMIAEPAFVHAVERIWSLIRDQAAQALRE